MSLLNTLNFHSTHDLTEESHDFVEVEYRLQSWGEIYAPFQGAHREHSLEARHILKEFPFKLFSVSIPIDGGLPQKLCLIFKEPHKEKASGIDSKGMHYRITGYFPEDTAKEFAAFLSLVTRRRVFAVGKTRENNLPLEASAHLYQNIHFQEEQEQKEIPPSYIYSLLSKLQKLDRKVADTFLLATKFYHSAIEMMFFESEFAYLFLIISLETISAEVNKDLKLEGDGDNKIEIEEFLSQRFPGWKKLKDFSENRDLLVQVLISKEKFIFKKVLKFIEVNLPEKFWTETEDDAKPTSILKFTRKLTEKERFEKKDLETAMRNAYRARSGLVHEGKRIPNGIVWGLYPRLPIDAFIETKTPTLLTLERVVSYSLVNYLAKQD